MPFASYTSVAEVARAYKIHCQRAGFITPVAAKLSEYFRSELTFTLEEVPFDGSEYAASETLIYPLLREVWKPFHASLTLWSHESIRYDDDLCGTPDYMVARRSPLGAFILDAPYLMVVEAKKDNFPIGWAQCLAAMVAAQKINALEEQTLYGMVTNGRWWEFGRLNGFRFLHDPRPFPVQPANNLAATIQFVMKQCHDQVAGLPVSA
jgi:hypothetical protein